MIKTTCKFCGKELERRKIFTMSFCNIKCKAEWQRTQKPATKEWLYQKYVVEELSANDIAKIVHRNPKEVWIWIRDYGIETRKRGFTSKHKFQKGQPSLFKGHKHSLETRKRLSEISKADGRVPYLRNGVHYSKGKHGPEVPSWKGGFTPERQKVYGSPEWRKLAKDIRKRDNWMCQRCGKKASPNDKKLGKFDIHHIQSFESIEQRMAYGNLVLLCEKCHYFVHSKENTNKEFIK